MNAKRSGFLFFSAIAVASLIASSAWAQSASSLDRIKKDVEYLASDELEGRGVETDGIHKAMEYIIKEYEKAGLKAGGKDGSFKQKFPVNVGRGIDQEKTKMFVFHGDEKAEMKIGKDFQPMMAGGAASIEKAGVAFVGYSISSEEHNYDDYKGIDVKGKVVIMLGREPQAKDKNSVFDGDQDSSYARLTTKFRRAKEAGAIGIIFVQDHNTVTDDMNEKLPEPAQFGTRFRRSSRLPFAVVPRAKINDFLSQNPLKIPTGGKLSSVREIEDHIDQKLEPVSQAVEGVEISYTSAVKIRAVDAFNVVGVIEGEGDLKNEVIVIGGHYDHLGMGPYGSRARGRIEVHNGADDNATGTAAVVELARRYGQYDKKPKRTLVFVCFSGEERGLVGSRFWCNDEPLYKLEDTIAMINYDMIGWLRESGDDGKGLTIYGSGTAAEFDKVLDQSNEGIDIKLNKIASPFAGSDHMPFNTKKIPCMFLHTGLTDTYHTPEDDYSTLNMEGADKVINYSEKLIWNLANMEKRPAYVTPTRAPRRGGPPAVRPPVVASNAGYLGVQFDPQSEGGATILQVMPETAAMKGGLRKGDIVTAVAGKEVKKPQDLLDVLSKKKAGDVVDVEVKRGETKIKTKIKLDKRPTTSDR